MKQSYVILAVTPEATEYLDSALVCSSDGAYILDEGDYKLNVLTKIMQEAGLRINRDYEVY